MTTKEVVLISETGRWWPEEGRLWADSGTTSLPRTYNREEAQEYVARYEEGEFYCAGTCGKWHSRPASFRYFAGLYCSPCAEAYKAANSRLCGICRQPLYACCC